MNKTKHTVNNNSQAFATKTNAADPSHNTARSPMELNGKNAEQAHTKLISKKPHSLEINSDSDVTLSALAQTDDHATESFLDGMSTYVASPDSAPKSSSNVETADNWSWADMNPYLPIGLSALTAGALSSALGSNSTSETTPVTTSSTFDSYVDNVGSIINTAVTTKVTTTDDDSPLLKGKVGTLASGEELIIYRDGKEYGTATVNSFDGTWYFQDGKLEHNKTYVYTAAVVNSDGEIKSALGGPFTITIDNIAPTATPTVKSYNDDLGSIKSATSTATTTDDTSPLINGVASGLTVSDIVNVYRDGVLLGTATIGKNGAWTYQDSGLVDGKTYKYTSAVSDTTGNLSATSTALSLTVDTKTPTGTTAITSYVDNIGTTQSTTSTATTTDDATPMLNGTVVSLQTGEVINVYRDTLLVGTATIGTEGKWTFQETAALAPGHEYSYTTAISDAAGNLSSLSSEFKITITPPASASLVMSESSLSAQKILASSGIERDISTQHTTSLNPSDHEPTTPTDASLNASVAHLFANNTTLFSEDFGHATAVESSRATHFNPLLVSTISDDLLLLTLHTTALI